jgi:hypothetical protein
VESVGLGVAGLSGRGGCARAKYEKERQNIRGVQLEGAYSRVSEASDNYLSTTSSITLQTLTLDLNMIDPGPSEDEKKNGDEVVGAQNDVCAVLGLGRLIHCLRCVHLQGRGKSCQGKL